MWWSDLGGRVVLTKISKSFNHCVQEVWDKHGGPHLVRIIILSLIWWWFCIKMRIVCVHCQEEGSIVSVHWREEMFWEINPPRTERFPKGWDFAPLGPRDCPREISRAGGAKSLLEVNLKFRWRLWWRCWWEYRHAMPNHIGLDSSCKLLHQGCLSVAKLS